MATCILVKDGQDRARFVGQGSSWQAALPALNELRTGIAKSTGVRISVDASAVMERTLEPARGSEVVIRFNLSDDEAFGKDTFRIVVAEEAVDFYARGEAGFLNAVYVFLERFCGFLWLWPGEMGEACDRLETLAVPVGTIDDEPAYLWRHLMVTDMDPSYPSKWTIMEQHLYPDAATMEAFDLWCRRNRLGGVKVKDAHTWGEMISPADYGVEHPNYFAEVAGSRRKSIETFTGKHSGQLCTTNPEVVDLLTSKVRRYFEKHSDVDVISVTPNDGVAFCECDRCIALDVEFGNEPPADNRTEATLNGTFKDDADTTGASSRITGPITDRIFTFANQIAERIAESHPDKKLLLAVYSLYRTPPRKVKLSPNIVAQFCLQCHQYWDKGSYDADMADMTTLSRERVGAGGV